MLEDWNYGKLERWKIKIGIKEDWNNGILE